jgi:glutathione S-transferase
MIIVYGFKHVKAPVVGETRDLRALWALEEAGLPYRVHGLDYTAGDTKSAEYRRISPFNQVPVIDDDGFLVAETGAVLTYIAEKAGKLIPVDLQGRTRVIQWCFAALSTIEPTLLQIQTLDHGGDASSDPARRTALVETTNRKFAVLEDQLARRSHLAGGEFTVADILMVTVLRQVRRTTLMQGFPLLLEYFGRCQSRPAWRKTLRDYETRLGAVEGAAD